MSDMDTAQARMLAAAETYATATERSRDLWAQYQAVYTSDWGSSDQKRLYAEHREALAVQSDALKTLTQAAIGWHQTRTALAGALPCPL